MEISEFLSSLKTKYNYSDEMIQLLGKAIPALIQYYGEEHKNAVLGALNDCEIHIQKENENPKEYLNQYFGTNKDWELPFLGGAFQHTELLVKDGHVIPKSIIYMKTEYLHQYKPFDFNDDDKVSGIIHEICHAVKGYGRIKVENGQVVTQTGLITDRFSYDSSSNTFTESSSTNTGLEEALNSYDEAEVMTIMTGIPHKYGAYKEMTSIARMIMEHKELASAIQSSQFSGKNEWIELLGKEDSDLLSKNFDDWVNILYSPPIDFLNDKLGLMNKMKQAKDNILHFLKNYTSPIEIESFKEARDIADKKTVEIIQQIIMYNSETNTFEQIEQNGKSL